MIRLSWRQFRAQAAVAAGLLVVVAVLLVSTRPHLAHLYGVYERAQAACRTSQNCRQVTVKIGQLDKLLELLGTVLVGIPAIVGVFWGAPLIAREFENGTQRLVWTQSVTRYRWLTAKLVVVGAASVIVTGLLSLLVTWWSSPIDRSRMDRFGAGMFGERNIVPLGYAAFGFALGVTAGLLIRRTLPAMAATLAGFLAVRLVFTYQVRSHLLAPVHENVPLNARSMGFGSTNGGPATLMPNPPDLPNAWIYSTRIVDGAGHDLPTAVVNAQCPDLGTSLGGPPPGSGHVVRAEAPTKVRDALQACVTKLSATYHATVTYQPANRYWTLQVYEGAIFLVAAVGLVGLCFWWIRHRAS